MTVKNLSEALKNSKGKIYYGMHFYPGVAEYQEEAGAYRVFLNEDTIRRMGPSFAGRPVFVEHVDGVEEDVDELRKDADGWVIESFFNAADGKHWVKFIVVTERADRAIQNGMRLSNAYYPTGSFGPNGQWNGVEYQKQILNGEYEHLAIVRHPRYEESVILSPEQFKEYNDNLAVELKRLANSKDERKDTMMKIFGFKKTKVENALDPEMTVVLEKSKREVSLADLVKEADDAAVKKNSGNEGLADMAHKVKMHDGSYCNVGEMLEKHKAMCDEMDKMKKEQEGDTDEMDGEAEMANEEIDAGGLEEETDSESSPEMQNEDGDEDEDEDAKKKKMDAEKKKNALETKRKAKEKADKLKNAPRRANSRTEEVTVEFGGDQVARGKSRYGSAV